jgi:hypothetical protein
MGIQEKKLTVGKLREFLADCDRDMAVTFGASRFRKRPFVFYRFKVRGEKLLQFELNELDQNTDSISEWETRITVGRILDEFDRLGYTNDCEITIGGSLDAAPTVLHSIKKVVAFNLAQPEEPQWKVEGD